MEISIYTLPFLLKDYSSFSERDGKPEYLFVGRMLIGEVGREISVGKAFIIPGLAPGEGYVHYIKINYSSITFTAFGEGAEYLIKWYRENQLLAYEPPTATEEHNIYPINGSANG